MREPIGFMAKAPVSEWNKRIGVDYPGVFKALLKAALAAATANAPGAISAAIDGFFAFGLEDAKRPPEELAWLLIRRALARAMAELTVEAARRHGTPLQDKDELVAALDQALDGANIWIDPAFFDRPAEHRIVEAVKPQFHKWLVALGLNEAEANSVNHRLGAYLTFALRREWAEHAEYAPLEAEFQKYENRFANADARERAWIRNADYLQRLIREPVFEEAFGLEQIYVPLRAWYKAPSKSARRGSRPEGNHEEMPRGPIVIDLGEHLDNWLDEGDRKDSLRVICGGPGSGKTSVAKIWAAKLARDGKRVLYVPLHRLDIRGDVPDVQTMLWEYLSDLRVLPSDPLDAKEGEARLLLIFDGLDELAMQGRAGQEVTRSFVDAVTQKVDRINERDERLVQVVLGGRDIVVEAARVTEHKVLHVLPYHGGHPKQFEDPKELLKSEDYGCDHWWRQFGEVTGEGYEGIPDPLQNDQLSDITAQPLLNYLLALGYRRGKLDFSTAPNLNLIYRDLLDSVYERPWGPATHPTKKVLSYDEFDQLLDELGLAAWHGAGRMFTESQVEQACQKAGLSEQLSAFKEGARAGAISLLAAFYFRQAHKIEGERTFEFTHKSFGEYLTARRIARWMEDIHEERARNRQNRQRGWSEEVALVKWVEITGPTALDHDLLEFLKREVALSDRETVKARQKVFVELLGDGLSHGLPMHRLQLPTFLEMTRQARNAEEALLAALHACAEKTEEQSEVDWPSTVAFGTMIKRVQGQRDRAGPLFVNECLGRLELVGHYLSNTDFVGAHLRFCNLEHTTLAQALLWRADLAGTKLLGANLFQANCTGANLKGANLKQVRLGGANLQGADLQEANLQGADSKGRTSKRRTSKGRTSKRRTSTRRTLEGRTSARRTSLEFGDSMRRTA
jgi:Pentapeptide repeats (8 copies)/NACHT domain